MIEGKTLEQFAALGPRERSEYILGRGQLEDLWLVGNVRNPAGNKPFFFIEQLQNPYTGSPLESNLLTDLGRQMAIFCSATDGGDVYKSGTLVAAKVKIERSSNAIQRGDILSTTFNDVYPIENQSTLYDLLKLTEIDLPILVLAKPTLYETDENRFVNIAELMKSQLEQEIMQAKQEQRKITADKLAAQEKLNEVELAYKQLENDREEILLHQQQLVELGFEFAQSPQGMVEASTYLDTPETLQELIKGIQAQLRARGYFYEERILRQTLLALMTGQMLILTGPSGTGKTTLVTQLASIINAKCEVIPVQPSWTDKQDLLGFYNPIRKLYVPTAFLDCLVEAKQNKDTLYFICLDELNLAQIEYYLADLLSVRELDDSQLRLYSDFEYKQNMKEVEWFVQRVAGQTGISNIEGLREFQPDTPTQYNMVMRYENLKRYAPMFTIPSNVRIIGTMNVDGAVQALSPKVIDRSFVIPLYRQAKEKLTVEAKLGKYKIPAAFLTVDTTEIPRISSTLREAMNDIQSTLANWQIEFNERVEKHLLLYYVASKALGATTKQQVDDLTVMKLLPRLHEIVDNAQQVTALKMVIDRYVGDEQLTKRKLEKMEQRLAQTGLFSYWS